VTHLLFAENDLAIAFQQVTPPSSTHTRTPDSVMAHPDGATDNSIQGRCFVESTSPWNLVFAHRAPYTSHRFEDMIRMHWPFKE